MKSTFIKDKKTGNCSNILVCVFGICYIKLIELIPCILINFVFI